MLLGAVLSPGAGAYGSRHTLSRASSFSFVQEAIKNRGPSRRMRRIERLYFSAARFIVSAILYPVPNAPGAKFHVVCIFIFLFPLFRLAAAHGAVAGFIRFNCPFYFVVRQFCAQKVDCV